MFVCLNINGKVVPTFATMYYTIASELRWVMVFVLSESTKQLKLGTLQEYYYGQLMMVFKLHSLIIKIRSSNIKSFQIKRQSSIICLCGFYYFVRIEIIKSNIIVIIGKGGHLPT